MSERDKEAAYAFAQSKPTEWESFKAQWQHNNPEPQINTELTIEPVLEQETAPKLSRKKKPASPEE
jgi:hypothetical protein